MRGTLGGGVGLIGIAGLAGCALVLGIDGKYENVGEGGKGGTSMSGRGGSGGDATTTATTGSGSASTAGTGGAGGAPGSGPLGNVGDACAPAMARACAGHDTPMRLVCQGDPLTWQSDVACADGENCDTRPGASQGTCAEVLPACVGKAPDTSVCDGMEIKKCGKDLLDFVLATPPKVCDTMCLDAMCTPCGPGQKRCFPGTQTPQGCGPAGEWQDQTSCQDSTSFCSNGDCTNPPSCQASGSGLTNCPLGNLSCCTSKVVTGGDFKRSYDGKSYGDAGYPATVSSFLLDRYEITVGRFRQFVNAYATPLPGAGAHPKITDSGWQAAWDANLPVDAAALKAAVKCTAPYAFYTWTDAAGANENKPMSCLTWYEAFAFCAWDQGRLPTEAEWNFAAAGGNEQRVFPWFTAIGSTPNVTQQSAVWHCTGDGQNNTICQASDLQNVGSRAAMPPVNDGKYSQVDLAGGVWEWTLDLFATYATMQCTDCANLSSGTDRVYRGGGWDTSDKLQVMTSYRGHGLPTDRRSNVGARCARSL